MLILSLLRHAKSSWKNPSVSDAERSLSSRGREAAPVMGEAIANRGLIPDLVLCSTARRTRETYDLVAPFLEPKPEVRYEKAIYNAAPETLLALIQDQAPSTGHLMMVGHNPGFHELAYDLTGSGPQLARDRLSAKLPTCGLVVLTFQTGDWLDVDYRKGELALFLVPSDLGLIPSPIDP